MNLRIPVYDSLPAKQKQYVHLAAGGVLMVVMVFGVSALIGDDHKSGVPDAGEVKTTTMTAVASSITEKEQWLGGAARSVAELKKNMEESEKRQAAEKQDLLAKIAELKNNPAPVPSGPSAATEGHADGFQQKPTEAAPPVNSSPAFPKQPRTSRSADGAIPAPGSDQVSGYPPGSPMGGAAPTASAEPVKPASPRLISISLQGAADSPKATSEPSTKGGYERKLSNYLPVSFMRASIMGGVDAPTGGQTQSDPIPIILKVEDNAVLPNGFRSRVKRCFVIANAVGDVSSERAYGRTVSLNCVLRNGQALEVPIKGQIYGEDGKAGIRGRLVSKQGQLLANALLSGFASGIGQGFSNVGSSISVSPLGTTATPSTDYAQILKGGAGLGVGKASEQLAQFYIRMAEKTFPVIEVDAGRFVDIAITEGVALDSSLDVQGDEPKPERQRTVDRSAMWSSLPQEQDE
jgi:conjugal transfer pilus assembly protein TraB